MVRVDLLNVLCPPPPPPPPPPPLATGHEYNSSGVFATNPRDAPGPVIFRESIVVGETTLSQQEVQQLVHSMGETYKGNRYHLLQRNCNHFSDELSTRLTNKHAPGWVSPRCSLPNVRQIILRLLTWGA